MINEIASRIGPMILAVVIATLLLVVVQVHQVSAMRGETASVQQVGECLADGLRWLSGAPIDTIGPGGVLRAIPVTLMLALGALTCALLLAGGVVFVEHRWPQFPILKFPGMVLSSVSFLPAVMLGYLVLLYYARYIRPGYSPVGQHGTLPEWAMVLISVGVLCLGNGVFQDMKEGITHDLENVSREDFLMAARSRGESTAPYMIRALTVPLLVRAFATLPVFIGAVIPFEKLFDIPGVGLLAFGRIEHFLESSDGTMYPVIILVMMLAVIVVGSSIVSDLLRFALDPRQRQGGSEDAA